MMIPRAIQNAMAMKRWESEWRERFEERAAIREFDGNMTRAKAEEEAFGDVDALRRAERFR